MGNEKARDFFWFYFSSIFQWKWLEATFIVARGNPWLPALNDSPEHGWLDINFVLSCMFLMENFIQNFSLKWSWTLLLALVKEKRKVWPDKELLGNKWFIIVVFQFAVIKNYQCYSVISNIWRLILWPELPLTVSRGLRLLAVYFGWLKKPSF